MSRPSPHLRCPGCPNKQEHHKPPIHGEGPMPCRIMFIGEGPGKTEDDKRERDGTGHPFIGDSGIELDQLYLPLMGLRRENVFITNVIRCLPRDKHGTDNPPLAKCCSDYFLWGEIRKVRPRVIITLGARSGRIIRPDLNLEYDHGRPKRIEIMENHTIVHIPMYHPAAGLRQPEYMQALLDDCTALRRQLVYMLSGGGSFETQGDPYVDPDYQECVTGADVDEYCQSSLPWDKCEPMGIDTEYEDHGSYKTPICLSFSLYPGTGRVIRSDNQEALDSFRGFCRTNTPRAIFHNWMADVGVLRDMGLEFPSYDDTMMLAYHLGNQPQALKVLSHRLCGMTMQEFDDLVDPYWMVEVLKWAHAGIPILKPPPPPKIKGVKREPAPKTGYERLGTNLARLCTDIVNRFGGEYQIPDDLLATYIKADYKTPAGDLKPKDRWEGWEGYQDVIPLIGNIPFKTLRLVPWPEAVFYACRDADATLRAYPQLLAKSRGIMARALRGAS